MTELTYQSHFGKRLGQRLLESGEGVSITVITVQEEFQGLPAELNRKPDAGRQALLYQKLMERVNVFGAWIVLAYDQRVADLFQGFRRQGVRIGTMDLMIASIVIDRGARLLTRNAKDFEKVPGLRFENWLDG